MAKKVADGDLSPEHLDVLADAAKKTKGASLNDKDLIAKVADANPDLGKSIIDKYLLDKDDAAGEQTRHDRQRRKRRLARFKTKDDCEALLVVGDKATIDAIWNKTTSIANHLYHQEGGRNVPADQHRRTHDQRMFDALTNQLKGDTSGNQREASDAPPGSAVGNTGADNQTNVPPTRNGTTPARLYRQRHQRAADTQRDQPARLCRQRHAMPPEQHRWPFSADDT